MDNYLKPLPLMDGDSAGFWEACRKHQISIQKCNNCGTFRFPPRIICPHCSSLDWEWQPVSGKGKVYTFIVMHQLYNKAFKDELPYNVALIELEEGAKIWTNLVNCPNEAIYIGMPVEVVYEDINEQVTLPKFQPQKGKKP